MIIAGIGFAGSYAAVRALAIRHDFGTFSYVFPIGIDAGICVLLALDLLLAWSRIPFPFLRPTAWLQTSLEAARSKLHSLDRLAGTRNCAPITLGTPIIPGQRQ